MRGTGAYPRQKYDFEGDPSVQVSDWPSGDAAAFKRRALNFDQDGILCSNSLEGQIKPRCGGKL
jgi:hypothetical protein